MTTGIAADWRIDDLAREADLTVDTIRFYAREGLIPPPRRAGRHKLYGPRHLDRLVRIRDLQERRFSLAAIRAILESEVPGVEALFTGGERHYTLDELVACSALDVELIEKLRAIDILVDPEEFGREDYDTTDLAALEAVRDLLEVGLPEEFLIELATIYSRQFASLQAEVMQLFLGDRLPSTPEDPELIRRRLAADSARIVGAAERILRYVHLRTLQRMALASLLETTPDADTADTADTGDAAP